LSFLTATKREKERRRKRRGIRLKRAFPGKAAAKSLASLPLKKTQNSM